MQGTAKVLSMLQSVPKVKEEPGMELEAGLGVGPGDTEGETIVLDTIAEFCRQVGEKEEGERVGYRANLISIPSDCFGGHLLVSKQIVLVHVHVPAPCNNRWLTVGLLLMRLLVLYLTLLQPQHLTLICTFAIVLTMV